MVSLEQFLNPHGRDHGPFVPKMTPRDENIVTKTPYPSKALAHPLSIFFASDSSHFTLSIRSNFHGKLQ